MARRPFDPAERGWKKTEYTQGDVTDTASVRGLVKGADVVVHLAFAILDASDATRDLNVEGSRRVFDEAAKAGAERICYASSVAAYGFHDDNPDWLTEDIPPRGSPEHPYSQQKAEVERVLGEVLLRKRKTVAYVFRPCVVAGPEARTMLEEIPYYRLEEAMPDAVARLLSSLPVLKPVIPDPGHPVPARARGRRGKRLRRRGARAGRAGALQPRGQRRSHHEQHRRRAGLVLGPGAEASRGRHRRDRHAAAAHAGAGGLDPLGEEARADEDRPREEAAALAAQAHRQGHAKEMADAQRAARYSSA